MTSIKTLENSIFWQKHVIKQSRDPKQIERCRQAVQRLEAQLAAALTANQSKN